MTKIEIPVADIRKGDLIRYECATESGRASEWRAVSDRDTEVAYPTGHHYLLDRPEQPFKVGTVLIGAGLNLYIRGGDGWYVAPATDETFDPRKSEFTDDLARTRVNQGVVKILSEPS